MRKQKMQNTNKGITLIALVITIIVMLILVAVTITLAINGGLFEYAERASSLTNNAIKAEQELGNGRIKIGNTWYDSIDDYIGKKPSTEQPEDPEGEQPSDDDFFIYEEGSGKTVIIGINNKYLVKTDNTKDAYYRVMVEVDGVKQDVYDITIPEGVVAIYGFGRTLIKNITLPSTLTTIGAMAFGECQYLESIEIPENVTTVYANAFYGCPATAVVKVPFAEGYTPSGWESGWDWRICRHHRL